MMLLKISSLLLIKILKKFEQIFNFLSSVVSHLIIYQIEHSIFIGYNLDNVYCTRFPNPYGYAGALHVSNRIFFDKLVTSLIFNVFLFHIACNLGGVDNMVACLIVNLITNSITKLGDWVEYTFLSYIKN